MLSRGDQPAHTSRAHRSLPKSRPQSATTRFRRTLRPLSLDTKIPLEGRTTPAGSGTPSRYVAALPAVPISLAGDKTKHFSLAPSVIIENPASAGCKLSLETGFPGRDWALAAKTNFAVEVATLVGGRRDTQRIQMMVSCLDEDTSILLADGGRVPIKLLVRGDVIRNPVTLAAIVVEEVIQGTQADDEMFRIGFGDSIVTFTSSNPVMTGRGLES